MLSDKDYVDMYYHCLTHRPHLHPQPPMDSAKRPNKQLVFKDPKINAFRVLVFLIFSVNEEKRYACLVLSCYNKMSFIQT